MKKISYLVLFSLLSSFNLFSAEEDVEEANKAMAAEEKK